MSSGSSLEITKSIYDPDKNIRKTVIHLSKGIARFAVTKVHGEQSSFTVVTPHAIAGVRGTEFVVTVDSNGTARFLVLEGKIETAPLLANGRMGKKELVGAGQMRAIYQKGKASKVKRFSSRTLSKIRKQTTIKHQNKKQDLSKPGNRMASFQSKREKPFPTLKTKTNTQNDPLPNLDTDRIARSTSGTSSMNRFSSLKNQMPLNSRHQKMKSFASSNNAIRKQVARKSLPRHQ